ncbi:peptidylprolyl isomerase [Oceanospirillaceae bacterium G-43]|uniref:Peptidyl-prolyl cis-trans isomerase n=2 Tax=Parathalassolituus penaei TaxID=2997323 RepID=A0A9X3EDY5_9GAMM|nr:peptidylprolyl isomerase [Parathalassolituus penaei]MCY0965837.1 peptidylprolyl isomerase [Parathalassolituus penaei]
MAGLATFSPLSQAEPVLVRLETNMGNIDLSLDRDKAPVSVDNFLTYVKSDQYNQTLFHRVIAGFMIQGGGYDTNMRQKATLPPIKNEADNGLSNLRGTIAMARTSNPNSATSQFFINVVDNRFLDHGTRDFGYAVFGKVTSGMDVVDAIAGVQTRPGDQPVKPVVLKHVQVLTEATTATPAK